MKILAKDTITIKNSKTKILYFRIKPNNLKMTIRDIIVTLTDTSWISKFDDGYIKTSLKARAERTALLVKRKLKDGRTSKKFKSIDNMGEYVVSELSRRTIVSQLNYLDIPLGEIIKESALRNPGFDFFSENNDQVLIFGEAKFSKKANKYGSALEQINRFEKEKKDKVEIINIRDFVSEESLNNLDNNLKGFAAAFSAKEISDQKIIKNIKKNKHFKELLKFEEIILVAVNL